ncbi:hypothetical protein G3578_10110 [Brevibacillus sp. SYP-B805]|uniref:XkdQ/YqbQ family protein n=1 Tax=Brevibacillus sp. SYP-B805 TaxID=1578199 RepID=UPI0013EA6602|nr:hypothetical protein [Brevibacillus sp. SYP-B805]NGQ95506.1 hypothetical protein [Brevibacillus sp. SYP-B805]
MSIEVVYDGKPLLGITSITWSGETRQPFRKLEVSLKNTRDGRTQLTRIEHGKELRLVNDDRELFRGPVFSFNINARGDMDVVAYDENIYLVKNQDTRKFANMTASAIIKRLCSDFGIPTGTIVDTGYVIPKLILHEKTLWDMMVTALTVTRKQTGRRYFISSKEGRIQLSPRKEQIVRVVLENGRNILDASYSQSIEEMRTQVKVIGGDEEKNPVIAVVKNDTLIQRYGIMQHLERAESDATSSQVQQLAQQLLKDLGTIDDEATIEAIGDDSVTAGTAIYAREQMTGIIGGYYITADRHTFQNGVHTMSLTLSATDDLPALEYEEPGDRKTKKVGDEKSNLSDVLKEIEKFGE